MKLLSIIIPVYNERETIEEVIRRVLEVNLSLDRELIILDGNSTDGTREYLQSLEDPRIRVIFEENRRGKGAAVRLGYDHATGDMIIIQDGDLELDPAEFPKLLAPILEGEAQAVYGTRFAYGRGATPFGSYMGNKIITWVTNLLFFSRLTDIATAYKVIRKDIVNTLHLSCNGFDFDAEITIKLLKGGIRIKEVPIAYSPRGYEAGKKLHWSAGFRILFVIIRNRLSG